MRKHKWNNNKTKQQPNKQKTGENKTKKNY